ncbi:VWA domain-containing protein [Granulicella sp. S190]|uniref:VWA domain-containing protein n=1 Tax=Granulicella sp. S190 TaxID=1747226 RepID=UPI00131AE034|nr:VWA domain-containing protein [Granulicella sp. S190]
MLSVISGPILFSQTPKAPLPAPDSYTLRVAVDEVSLTFHAADFHGIPMDDLKLDDLRILDNGKPPRQIVSFEAHQNLPVHFGILMDTSQSMLEYLPRNQAIANQYLTQLLRKQTDRVFLMRFDSESKVLQDWTSEGETLTASLHSVSSDHASRLGGTALFDSIYKACRDQFGTNDPLNGNFILLFTDGIDNASHARLEDDIDICQQANVAIYTFSIEPKSFLSEGQKILTKLSNQTGGVLFFDQTRETIWNDLRVIDSNLRSQYRLVYKPQHFKRDGSFHRIKLDSPTRGGVIITRSGYYATH